MPFCKTCGTLYPSSLGVCPKCNAESILLEQPEAVAPEALPPEEAEKKRKRSWIGILLGIPGLIVLIYGVYLFMRELSPR